MLWTIFVVLLVLWLLGLVSSYTLGGFIHVLLVLALVAFNDYGMLASANSGILVQPVNLSPSPTELVPEAETIPASAGVVVLPERSFLGWRKISAGVNVSGWVRDNAMMPFYQTSRH